MVPEKKVQNWRAVTDLTASVRVGVHPRELLLVAVEARGRDAVEVGVVDARDALARTAAVADALHALARVRLVVLAPLPEVAVVVVVVGQRLTLSRAGTANEGCSQLEKAHISDVKNEGTSCQTSRMCNSTLTHFLPKRNKNKNKTQPICFRSWQRIFSEIFYLRKCKMTCSLKF